MLSSILKYAASVTFIFLCCEYAYANTISLHLTEANLAETIFMFAQLTKMNIVLSPQVQGSVSLNLKNTSTQDAFQLLLISHGLATWKTGNVWLVAPRDELMKQHQEELKWHELQEAALPLQSAVVTLHYAKAEDIAHVIQDDEAGLISKRGYLRVDARTNALYVQDVPANLFSIRHLIKQLDVPVKQILIEARLASIDDDFEQELGLDFSLKQTMENKSTETVNRHRYSLAVVRLPDGSMLDMKLAALENSGHAELISSPSLFTANQQTASIEAGEEVPYQEVSESGGTAVTFKKAVLGLKVTPQILPGHKILLQLQINQDRPSSKMVLGVPTISTRQINTNVLVKDGQTIVLGGIYETNHEKGEERVPFLSAIPLVGELFKMHLTRNNKRELMIFVTPKTMA